MAKEIKVDKHMLNFMVKLMLEILICLWLIKYLEKDSEKCKLVVQIFKSQY